MMGTLQLSPAGQAVSSQNLSNAIENIEQDTDRRDRKPTTIVGRRKTSPEELGQAAHQFGGLTREIAAWLGYVDPKHEAGKLIERITKGTLRATEAWTDGRHAEDDKYVELDYELSVATGQCDRRRGKSHSPKDNSNGAKSWVRGMASIGRRLCAQVVERPG